MDGALTIFYRHRNGKREYLIVQNTSTGNISFVGGAQESGESLEDAARREIKEELGLRPDQYTLALTDVVNEFVFGNNKPERAGQKGYYHVFLADGGAIGDIPYTDALKDIAWKSEEDVLKSISFEDLKDVFSKAILFIKD